MFPSMTFSVRAANGLRRNHQHRHSPKAPILAMRAQSHQLRRAKPAAFDAELLPLAAKRDDEQLEPKLNDI